eukprot:g27131.t1
MLRQFGSVWSEPQDLPRLLQKVLSESVSMKEVRDWKTLQGFDFPDEGASSSLRRSSTDPEDDDYGNGYGRRRLEKAKSSLEPKTKPKRRIWEEAILKSTRTCAVISACDALGEQGDKLEGVYELPPEEETPEAPEKPPMPERRVPYSMHIVTQLPQHKHLKEESNAQHYIEEKVVGALENFEDFIRHVEDNFHREKRPEKAKAKSSADVVDEEEDVIPSPPEKEWGHKVLMPYVFKATVTLVNHHKIALSNPEKHAQASLQDHATAGATDHMVDVLRKSLREEKNRMISNKRKQAEHLGTAINGVFVRVPSEEALYQRIEASK